MNALNWFEIPATDLGRAQGFYERLLGRSLHRENMGESDLAIFPYEQGKGVGGCLIAGPGEVPVTQGTVVYLDAGPAIDAVLARVAGAGGKVALEKTALPEGMGYFAHIIDSEGNRVGLHAMQ